MAPLNGLDGAYEWCEWTTVAPFHYERVESNRIESNRNAILGNFIYLADVVLTLLLPASDGANHHHHAQAPAHALAEMLSTARARCRQSLAAAAARISGVTGAVSPLSQHRHARRV